MHMQRDVGIASAEGLNNSGQHVAALRMSRGNRKRPFTLIAQLIGHRFNVLDAAQHIAASIENSLPSSRYCDELLTTALEYLNTQFIFQRSNLLTYTRLRGKQRIGCLGYIKALTIDFPDITQLL